MLSEDDKVLLSVHIKTAIILVLCTAGIIGHVISIHIFYSMINPNNLFMISMSCTQIALCANFFYSSLFKYLSDVYCISQFWSHAWVATLLVSVNASVVVYMSGVFHVIALSIIRFISLNQIHQTRITELWFSYSKCLRTIILINIGAVLLCIPFFFNSEVRKVPSHRECSARYPSKSNLPTHELSFTILASSTALGQVNFWLLGIMCKLIPCAIMIVMTVLLIQKLRQIQLLSIRFTSPTREKRCRRITYITMVIMINFMVVELPQGVFSVLSSVKGTSFTRSELLGDLFDIFSLLNSCITFALFCSMSSRVRNAFAQGLFPFNYKYLQQIIDRLRQIPVVIESSNSNDAWTTAENNVR
ncbi:Serpentine type 7TM GPCR chemoreceptor Srw family protein [Acanthocheilonema viteae]